MAAAVEELTVSVNEVTRHAHEAHDLSEHSGQGADTVSRTVREMDLIAAAVSDSSAVIEDLGQRSQQITAIVNVIKEIADQTNLLALNAAIEAARAGESGRGFAVVADEVRKLAERTGKSTAEISAIVQAIQDGTAHAVASMQDGVERVRGGVALAREAGASMQDVGNETARVVRVVGDISMALKEQTSAATEIARNVEKIAQMAEENNAAVGQTADTANELQSLAQRLQTEMQRFRV
ncbi:methyl-accepting chemotaxis protein [Aromatoleum aromaticum]|uniref:methyl-accepting chemotaxis protein n=1 Tax=Aromatoleum aromaticum TaxID=551760 RepID=UPI0014593AED|nr:methyl-accepting chemotaxis protein [Aromatoleum aromaticum]NMG55502.1 hypothetical protein [Aromatoleum aromaticum]